MNKNSRVLGSIQHDVVLIAAVRCARREHNGILVLLPSSYHPLTILLPRQHHPPYGHYFKNSVQSV